MKKCTDLLHKAVVVRVVRCEGPDSPPLDFLSDDDRSRAARFRFEEDRSRFVFGRRLLAQCLVDYLGDATSPLEFTLTNRGRPELPDVQFSISHTGDLVAVALSNRAQVGVDLERVRDRLRFADLAERIFSREELQDFLGLAPSSQPAAFFQAWTGKEACLKATGQGISMGMPEVLVPMSSNASAQPLVNRHDGAQPQPWRIQSLPLPDGYTGNVVWNDPELAIDFEFVEASELLA